MCIIGMYIPIYNKNGKYFLKTKHKQTFTESKIGAIIILDYLMEREDNAKILSMYRLKNLL